MEYEWEDASLLSIRGNAMDGAIKQGVVQPLPVLDIVIGGVFADDEDKGGARLSIMLNNITYAELDIAHELLARRITIAPLCGIAVSRHLLAGIGEDSHKGIYVGVCGRTDGHRNCVEWCSVV